MKTSKPNLFYTRLLPPWEHVGSRGSNYALILFGRTFLVLASLLLLLAVLIGEDLHDLSLRMVLLGALIGAVLLFTLVLAISSTNSLRAAAEDINALLEHVRARDSVKVSQNPNDK